MKQFALYAGVAACALTPAFAQEDGDDTQDLDTIVVTAQRREQTLAEVPISVNVISGADIARQEIRNVEDLVLASPSVNVVKTTNSSAFNLSIRGQGPAAQERGVEQSVGIYIDGVYRSRPVAGIADFVDINRIEIIKGPQSSIFGRNNSAGALSIVTLDPTEELTGSYALGWDNFDTFTAQGTVSGPLASDKVRGRLSVSYRDRGEGTIDNLAPDGPTVGTFERLSLRGIIQADLSDQTELKIIADYSDLQDECCGFVPYFVPDADVPVFAALGIEIPGLAEGTPGVGNGVPGTFIDLDRRELFTDTGYGEVIEDWGVQAELNHDFGPVVLTILGASRTSTSDVNFELDGSAQVIPNLLPYRSVPSSKFEESQAEIRLTSDATGPFQYMGGLYYFTQTITDDNTLKQSTFDLLNVSTTTEAEAFAVFGQVSYDLTDALTATVGLRYNTETKDFRYSDIDPFGGFGLGPGFAADSSVEDDAVIGDAAVNYALNQRNSLYARYARGYKSPGANLLTFGAPNAEVLQFDAETVDAYEVGWKFGTRTLRGSAAVFYQETNDLQVQTINLDAVVPLLQVDNAAKVKAQGIELEALWEPTDALLFSGGVTYLDAEFLEYENASALAIGPDGLQDLSGETPLQSPELAGSFSAQYTYDINERFSLSPRADVNYKGEHFVTAASDPFYENDAYTLLHLSLDVIDEEAGWTLSLYGRNVTDETFLMTGTAFRLGLGGPAVSAQQGAINDPATYGLMLRGSF